MSPVLHADPKLGVVYTPAAVARPMTQLALAPLVRGRSAREILALRVCDPAIGEGAFLVQAREILAEGLHAAWQREGHLGSLAAARAAVSRCLVGCDIDGDVISAIRRYSR